MLGLSLKRGPYTIKIRYQTYSFGSKPSGKPKVKIIQSKQNYASFAFLIARLCLALAFPN